MAQFPEIIPISDLRQDAAGVVKSVKKSAEPVIITQRGRAAAVLLSIEAYRRAQRERELLLLLAKGEEEIEAGKGHSLGSVLAAADALLETD
jgi:prevent-host-death family protein